MLRPPTPRCSFLLVRVLDPDRGCFGVGSIRCLNRCRAVIFVPIPPPPKSYKVLRTSYCTAPICYAHLFDDKLSWHGQSYITKGIWRHCKGSYVRNPTFQHYALSSYALTCALLTWAWAWVWMPQLRYLWYGTAPRSSSLLLLLRRISAASVLRWANSSSIINYDKLDYTVIWYYAITDYTVIWYHTITYYTKRNEGVGFAWNWRRDDRNLPAGLGAYNHFGSHKFHV